MEKEEKDKVKSRIRDRLIWVMFCFLLLACLYISSLGFTDWKEDLQQTAQEELSTEILGVVVPCEVYTLDDVQIVSLDCVQMALQAQQQQQQ